MKPIENVCDREFRDEFLKPKPVPHPDLSAQNYRRRFDPEHDEWGDQLEED